MLFDPGALRKLQEERLLQPPTVTEVDILDTGALSQPGFFTRYLTSRASALVLVD
jgi:hypothetical protein